MRDKSDIGIFKAKIADYKQSIDADIKAYGRSVSQATAKEYGQYSGLATDVFLDILARPGKRIRGSLVCLGYEMSGGRDNKLILEVARAVEMIHAYILIIDDIQDRSPERRGGPAAHVMLADYHREQGLPDDSAHFGLSLALNSALGGMHAALTLLSETIADEKLRLKVISRLNSTMLTTVHGQTNDIINGLITEAGEDDLNKVIEWKTAQYSILNPLHVGMVLAGADDDDTDAIVSYATDVGYAYQITDDILDTIEDGGDIKEGKQTLLTLYARQHAGAEDAEFLGRMLGNQDLTDSEFKRCKDILESSGALKLARQRVQDHINRAIRSLDQEKSRWTPEGVAFLRGLAEYLLTRRN